MNIEEKLVKDLPNPRIKGTIKIMNTTKPNYLWILKIDLEFDCVTFIGKLFDKIEILKEEK